MTYKEARNLAIKDARNEKSDCVIWKNITTSEYTTTPSGNGKPKSFGSYRPVSIITKDGKELS